MGGCWKQGLKCFHQTKLGDEEYGFRKLLLYQKSNRRADFVKIYCEYRPHLKCNHGVEGADGEVPKPESENLLWIVYMLHHGHLGQLVVILGKWTNNTYLRLHQGYLGQLIVFSGKLLYYAFFRGCHCCYIWCQNKQAIKGVGFSCLWLKCRGVRAKCVWKWCELRIIINSWRRCRRIRFICQRARTNLSPPRSRKSASWHHLLRSPACCR